MDFLLKKNYNIIGLDNLSTGNKFFFKKSALKKKILNLLNIDLLKVILKNISKI